MTSASHPNPRALTVILATRGETDEILALLADYAAVELVGPFLWVDAADVQHTAIPATLVQGGHSSTVVLQQILTGHRHSRVRIAVLIPADAPAEHRVTRADEQKLEQVVRAGAVSASITLLRLLFTRGSAADTYYDPAMVLEGWHNLLVAPEDSAGPGLGVAALERLDDQLDVARYVAPVVASVAGLWNGVEKTVFDELAILPGQTLRAVRAFYRQLDALEVEDQLRRQLFDSGGRLPLPRSTQASVLYVQDVQPATRSMAQALWTKHRDVLRGGRVEVGGAEAQAISARAAGRLFLSFLWAALRNAPSAWLAGMLNSVSSVVAATVQHTVFGGSNSAYSVVAGGDPSKWQEIGRGAEEMVTALGGGAEQRQFAQPDLTALWVDYANFALTLADGGRRSAGPEPIRVGSAVGVVSTGADVVPASADAFTGMPASLAAVIGIRQVAGGDVLGAADAKHRLERTFGDPAAGVEARQAFTALGQWEAATARSYATQTSAILVDFLGRARMEVAGLVERIRELAGRSGEDGALRRRQQAILTIMRTAGWTVFAVLLALLGVAVKRWVGWRFPLQVGGVLLVLYFVAMLIMFILMQRHLFAELNLRKTQMSEFEALQLNLRSAVQDVSRLSAAYGQLMAWNRVLGEVLRAPFGPVAPLHRPRPQIVDGLPRCMRIAVAAPTSGGADETARALQQELYAVGWLTAPWERMLESAGERLPEDPAGLFRMPGVGSGSPLDRWSHAVESGRVTCTGASALWRQVQEMFDRPDSPIGRRLIGTIVLSATGQRVSPAEFNEGLLPHRAAAAPFDASLFTTTAATAGRAAVAIHDDAVDRHGLGYRAVVVEVGDGLPIYDFAMFAPRTGSVDVEADLRDHPTMAIGETPPGSGSMVF